LVEHHAHSALVGRPCHALGTTFTQQLYVMLFIVSFQVATMFNSLRTIALGVVHFAERA